MSSGNDEVWHARVRLIAHMGPGRDRLEGSSRDDLLDGGPGQDKARAGGGDDTCVSIEKNPGRDCETNSPQLT